MTILGVISNGTSPFAVPRLASRTIGRLDNAAGFHSPAGLTGAPECCGPLSPVIIWWRRRGGSTVLGRANHGAKKKPPKETAIVQEAGAESVF